MMRDNAILFISHKISEKIIDRFYRIMRAAHGFADIFFLTDINNDDTLRTVPKDITIIVFDWNSLKGIGYTPIFNDKIVPGSNHFILLWFYLNNPGYKFYWNIEYDVEYAGNWINLLNIVSSSDADFQTCCIRRSKYHQDWYWLWAYYSPSLKIHPCERIISFNPFYRISARALSFLDLFLKQGSYGHHEVLIPTSLYYSGFKLEDLGGEGEFVRKECINKVYTINHYEPVKGSMRYRPVFLSDEIKRYKDLLCHPVK
ncbi:MAG: hypothetical protein K2G52_02135 [Muribaculaceae bacterium]|nr:hypothetical protein [Muribaculaceae bacterium]